MRLSDELASRSAALLKEFEHSDVHHGFFQSYTESTAVRTVVRRLLFEVATYGPWITSATFTAVGRLSQIWPNVTPFAEHLLEEVPHPTLAMEGFLALGGEPREAAAGKLSPASFALAAVCRRIAEEEHPTSYLGYVYLLESTTVTLAVRLQDLLASAELEVPFLTVHATEDVGHTRGVAAGIDALVEKMPEARPAIIDGFDYFSSVYPLPIWSSALQAAQRELGSR